MAKWAETIIDGVTTPISRKPRVKEKDGAIEVSLAPNILIKLSPDAAKMVADVFSDWQYETYS
jgi:hypothetical protein